MDAGDWIAVVAAVIASGSMGVALWQAREAKESRHAAQAQAAAAKDSAEIAEAGVKQAQRSAAAAEEQTRATVEQLAILREQVAEQRAEKDNPQFHIPRPTFSGEDMVPVDITMVAGTDLRSLTVSVTGKDVQGFSGDPRSDIEGGEPIVCPDVAIGFETTVWVSLHDTLDTSILVRIDCEAADGRKWARQQPMRLMHHAIRDYGH
ncbi:hypothetical protein [Umezawaea sp. Da 62-37]|uniref:hypothetical protein n=1 Tax=Umezawaea sp. Da 62-37 TaxID=3075927 RepID=UPI0028F6D94F|nr:hypothetical protein [Umezawaea sp. Da 62-37]WNV83698.1 hypothetical protein RM788_36780 [Umezawaea sp. Da 62-37]